MFHSVSTPDIFAIIGRKELESKLNLIPDDLVLIHITDPNQAFIETNNKFKDELKMKFWDWEGKRIGSYSELSKNQAKEIKEFILKNKGNKFIINCEAGQSRSAAIGMAIEWLFRDEFMIEKFSHFPSKVAAHERYDPNMTLFFKIVNN